MTTPRTHRRIQIPVITVYCDDAIHADVPAQVVARFGNYPPGRGWRLLSDLYEDQFDDTNTTDHRRRFADEAVTIGGRTRYNLRCPKCDRRRKRRPVTVPVKQDRLQSVCDLLAGAGEFAPTLTAFAAIVRRSAGREH